MGCSSSKAAIPVAYPEVRSALRSGDVVLFTEKTDLAYRPSANAQWTRCGLVLRLDVLDLVMLVEANTSLVTRKRLAETGLRRIIKLTNLNEKVFSGAHDLISVRNLECQPPTDLSAPLLQAIMDLNGTVYSPEVSSGIVKMYVEEMGNLGALVSSEMTASLLSSIGLLSMKRRKGTYMFLPKDFADKGRAVLKNSALGTEFRIKVTPKDRLPVGQRRQQQQQQSMRQPVILNSIGEEEDLGIAWRTLAADLQTGDLILIRGASSYMQGFQRLHNCEYGSVAMVVRPPSPFEPLILLFEAQMHAENDTSPVHVGARIVGAEGRLSRLAHVVGSEVWVRRLKVNSSAISDATRETWAATVTALRQSIAERRSNTTVTNIRESLPRSRGSVAGLVRRASMGNMYKKEQLHRMDVACFFSGEIVARGYQALGLIATSAPVGTFTTASFVGNDVPLTNATLMPAMRVNCGEEQA